MSRRIAPEGATAHPDEVTATVTAGAKARMKLPGSPSSVRAKAPVNGSAITATVKTGDDLSSAQAAPQQPSTDAAGEANGKVASLGSDTTDFEKYLDRAVDVATLPIPLVKFPGVKLVVPAREWTCKGLQELADEIAPTPAPIFTRKEDVPYYIAGVLRDAELTNKRLRQERQREGQSTVGRQPRGAAALFRPHWKPRAGPPPRRRRRRVCSRGLFARARSGGRNLLVILIWLPQGQFYRTVSRRSGYFISE